MSASQDVEVFFRRHPSESIPVRLARKKLRIMDVPQTEDGLRQLAKCNNWSAVAQLSEMLEKQYTLTTTNFQHKESLFRLILVRATAHIRLGEPQRALAVLNSLGDLHSEAHVNPDTGVSVVPFSCVFLTAFLPALTGDIPTAFQRLYALLEETIAQEQSKRSDNSKDAVRWRERQRRVRRALVSLHNDQKQFEACAVHLNALIDMSTDLVKQMLLMQQLGSVALKNGNGAVAASAFKKMRQLLDDDEDATPEAQKLCDYLGQMNDVLIHVFYGEYDAAIEKAKKLMMINPYTGEPVVEATGRPSTSGTSFSSLGVTGQLDEPSVQEAGSISFDPRSPTMTLGGSGQQGKPVLQEAEETDDDDGRANGFTHFNVAAANAFIVLHPFASDEQYNLRTAVTFAESLIKRHPRQMLASNATLYNLKTLHNLEGDENIDKQSLMRAVVDYFRCGPESLPSEILP